VIFSWILVSLGAPFWYDLLKKLVSLRSLLAKKDDEERKARETSQQPATASPTPPAAPPKVLSADPDLVEIRTATVLRSGKPSATSPEAGKLDVETLVSVSGSVEGDVITDAQNRANKKWYQTPEGHFFWAGATDKP
jgi:hypothetical protein